MNAYSKVIVAVVGLTLIFLSMWLFPDTAAWFVAIAIGVLTAFGVYIAPNTDPLES